MKILYISFIDPEGDVSYGGGHGSLRNFKILSQFGQVEKYIIKRKSKLSAIQSICERRMSPERKYDDAEILNKIRAYHFDLVWIDSSMSGELAREIKNENSGVTIFSYFHNVEYDYVSVRIGNKFKQYIYKKIAKIQEYKSIKFCDECFVLHDLDMKRLLELYPKRNYIEMPVTFKDTFDASKIKCYQNDHLTGLFVGAYNRANSESLSWYLNNSNTKAKFELVVIGKDFENHINEFKCKNPNINLKIIGTVDDVSEYYYRANFVLAPIVIGAGMKVKIAEALMYGKTIVGTNEAFAGYHLNFDKVGMCSDNINDLDEKINKLYLQGTNVLFNPYSRQAFVDQYTDDAAKKILGKVLRERKIE